MVLNFLALEIFKSDLPKLSSLFSVGGRFIGKIGAYSIYRCIMGNNIQKDPLFRRVTGNVQ